MLQSLAQQVHVVTGANTGLGFATSRELARRGARVVMVCRDAGRCEAAAARLRRALERQRGDVAGSVSTATCDLASPESIARFVDDELPRAVGGRRVDALVNNAGIMTGRRLGERTAAGGVDETVWTNHCGPAALTARVLEGFDVARCVMVASRLEKRGRADEVLRGDEEDGAGAAAPSAYATSKQFNLLFSRELARRRPDVLTVSVTPGMVNTSLGRYHPLFSALAPLRHAVLPTPESGCGSIVYAATEGGLAPGGYYGAAPRASTAAFEEVEASPAARADATAAKLWDWTDARTDGALRRAERRGAATIMARVPLEACASGQALD